MNITFGAPGFARSGAGHAGVDSAIVLPRFPGNAVPGLYSRIAIDETPVSDVPGGFAGAVTRDARKCAGAL
jgi:hypothetical protein